MSNYLNLILNAVKERGDAEAEQGEDKSRKLRLSLSGYKSRYIWHVLNNTERDPHIARDYMNFATGHLVHKWIQDTFRDYGDFEVIKVEETVTDQYFEDCQGHYDILVKDPEGKYILIEIKTTSHFNYVKQDPSNGKRSIYFSARNYSFNPWDLIDTKFNYSWLYQVASYVDAAQDDISEVLLVIINKNTGHIAVGAINEVEELENLVDERVKQWDAAIDVSP